MNLGIFLKLFTVFINDLLKVEQAEPGITVTYIVAKQLEECCY